MVLPSAARVRALAARSTSGSSGTESGGRHAVIYSVRRFGLPTNPQRFSLRVRAWHMPQPRCHLDRGSLTAVWRKDGASQRHSMTHPTNVLLLHQDEAEAEFFARELATSGMSVK